VSAQPEVDRRSCAVGMNEHSIRGMSLTKFDPGECRATRRLVIKKLQQKTAQWLTVNSRLRCQLLELLCISDCVGISNEEMTDPI